MTAEIRTVIGHLNIVGGKWQDEAPNQVAVREPKSADVPGAGKGDLFVLTEVRGHATNPKAVEQQLAETIRDAYYLAHGSTTISLRHALQAANDQLYRYNQKADSDKVIVAGAVVLILQNDEAFCAQIGPPALFAVLSDLIRRYPAQSGWLDRKTRAKDTALGIDPVVEPNLHHLYITAGDMLILTDSHLASHLSLDNVVKAISLRNVKATIKNLGNAAGVPTCSAMVLATVEAEQSAVTAVKIKAPAQLGRLLHREHQPGVPAEKAMVPSVAPVGLTEAEAVPELGSGQAATRADPLAPAKSKPLYQKLPRWFGHSAKTSPEEREHLLDNDSGSAVQFETTTAEERIYHPAHALEMEDEPELQGKVMDSVAHDPGFHPELGHHSRAKSSSFSIGRILRWVSAGLLLLLALLGNGLRAVFGLVLPSGEGRSPRQAGAQVYQQPSTVSWVLLRNIVIAIPVIVGLIVAISYVQKGRVREAEYQGFLTNAQGKFQQAQAAAVDPAAALGLMAESEGLLAQAEQIKGPQPEINELRESMTAAAEKVSKVERLFYVPQLRQYTDSGTSLKNIVVQGVELYVLDTGNDRIFHHKLDDLGEALLPDDESHLIAAKGQQVDHISVGDLLGMTWMPTGGNRQTSDLVVLNSTGLLEYNPNWGITTATLASTDLLTLPVAVSSYFGNFYILDPQANRLLRYLPTADGYSATPENYFSQDQPVDLANAVDFAIDGAIYVLFVDGGIGKYQSGNPVPFNVSGLDVPLSQPVAIFTAPDETVQYVYVADAGNQRIVQLEKDGRFVRQFRPDPSQGVAFANLQDIYVDEISGRLYILDSNNLYTANISSTTGAD